MTACNRCNGTQAIPGHWTAEPCPECDGTGEFVPAPSHAPMFTAIAVLLLVALVLVAFSPLIAFYWAVLT